MSSQIFASSYFLQTGKPKVIRQTIDFEPSVWGDRFLTYVAEDKISRNRKEQRIKELKYEVKREIVAVEPSQQLNIIDAIQRLGVDYHFENEIEETLQHIYEKHQDYEVNNNRYDDLYNVSLRFRLLRQQGYNISCDIFNKYKEKNGNLSESLIGDTLGMLGLYEATHLRKHGEDILDEAFAFTSSHLQLMKANHLSKPLTSQVAQALKQPIRMGIPRLEARMYMPIYHEIDSHNKAILELAKMDFNIVQSVHKKELSDITMWWKNLDFTKKLPFVRDKVVESYFWMLAICFEPQYSLTRIIITKIMLMLTILDDIYDSYGTLEELELFTQEIERGNTSNIDQLPEYMKIFYQALLDFYEEIENEKTKHRITYPVHVVREHVKSVANAYLEEAKWINQKYQPTVEEYMRIGLKTTSFSLLIAISFVGMGDIVTQKFFEWALSDPKIITASATICRLTDDIDDYKSEQQRGRISAVDCYMKEYGVSEQQAYDELRRQIENAWKDMNEECLKPTIIPTPLLTRVLNLARVTYVVYKEADIFAKLGIAMKNLVALLFIDPVPI